MKKLVYLFLTVFSLSFFSCNFLGVKEINQPNLTKDKSLLTIVIGNKSPYRTAVLAPNFTSLYSNIGLYRVKIQPQGGTAYTTDINCSGGSAGEIKIPLQKNKYNIKLYGYKTEDIDSLTSDNYESLYIVYDEATIDLSTGDQIFNAKPLPKNNGSGKGSLSYSFKFSKASNANYTVTALLDNSELDAYKNKVLNCASEDQTLELNISNISVGNHLLVLTIKNNFSQKSFVKSFPVVIYNNVVTSSFINSDGSLKEDTFVLDSNNELNINTGTGKIGFIVFGDGATHSSKSKATIATEQDMDIIIETSSIQEAVDIIEKTYDFTDEDWADSFDYTPKIFIDGTVTLEPKSGEESLITIGKNGISSFIQISGYQEDDTSRSDTIKIENTSTSRLIYIEENASLVLKNITLQGGNVQGNSKDGGGIYCEGNLTTNYVTIKECKALTGGCIYAKGVGETNFALLDLNNSTIADCESNSSGGGIYINNYSELLSEEGLIITNNKTTNINNGSGGGIYTSEEHTKLSLTGTKITNNSAYGAGGLYNYISEDSDGNCISKLINCEITENSAKTNGGGIATASNSCLQLTNCVIKDNSQGSGSYEGSDIFTYGTIILQGATQIGEIYLVNYTCLTLDTSDENKVTPITGQTTCATIKCQNYTGESGGDRIILSAKTGSLTEDLCNLFTLQDTSYTIDNTGKVVSNTGGGDNVYTDWSSLLDAVENATEGDEFVIGADMTASIPTGKDYGEITNIVPIKITTNGNYKISRGYNYLGAFFNPNTSIEIDGTYDSGKGLTFDGNNYYSGSNFIKIKSNVFSSGSSVDITIKNCAFNNNSNSTDSGGAISYNIGEGTSGTNYKLTIQNCSFQSNKANNGGALYLNTKDSTVVIEACTFKNNNYNMSNGGGGAICITRGNVTIKGDYTEIVNNTKYTSKNSDIYFSNAGSTLKLEDSINIGYIEFSGLTNNGTWSGIELGTTFTVTEQITINFVDNIPTSSQYLFTSEQDISSLLGTNPIFKLDTTNSILSIKSLKLTDDNKHIYLQ